MQGIFRRLARAVAGLVLAGGLAGLASAADAATCSRFTLSKSSAFNGTTVALPWRADLPPSPGTATHAWEAIPLTSWEAYMAAVLAEVRASGLKFQGNRIVMNATADWWITPWMDYGDNGREKRLGLTKERNAQRHDLSPTSAAGAQVWAVGFYNREGASALAKVFADPCDPVFPSGAAAFPAKTASFKLLFTNASATQVRYLAGGPQVNAFIGNSVASRTSRPMRLLQMDIAVKDARSPTGWVFGTYIWKGPPTGDRLLDNLVPVGLMWGNDPTVSAPNRDDLAQLQETRLNPALAGVVWRGPDQAWPERPWPGFQGRLNGPADNLRSSCISCHGLAQWPRSIALGIVPNNGTYSLANLASQTVRDDLRAKYLKNVPAGVLTNPAEATPNLPAWGGAKSLDYSMQLEAAFDRMCQACKAGAMTGATPAMCRIPGLRSNTTLVTTPTCPPASSPVARTARTSIRAAPEPPPRQ